MKSMAIHQLTQRAERDMQERSAGGVQPLDADSSPLGREIVRMARLATAMHLAQAAPGRVRHEAIELAEVQP